MPRLAEINLTQGHQFFQKEERDISALLSELEEGVTVMSGDGDTEDSRRPYPVPLRRLVEEAVTRRESTRRETHLTWVTAGVILLLTVQVLSVSTLIYRAVGGAGEILYPGATPTRHQQPDRASRLILGLQQPSTIVKQSG